MLKATLISIDNDDLEGISFDKIREFEDKLGLLPVDEDTKRNGMEATYAERVKMLEEDHSKFKVCLFKSILLINHSFYIGSGGQG